MPKVRTLFIINKILPDSDFRLAYARDSAVCDVVFGLPEKSAPLADENYLHLRFEEGLNAGVLLALRDLFFYLRKNRRSLGFVHFFTTNPILLGPLVARLAGVPYVITVTGYGRVTTSADRKFTLLRPVYNLLFGHSVRHARRVLLQNRTDHASLTGRYPAVATKFVYVGSATDMPVLVEKDFSQTPLKVLSGTRLMPDKGIEDFIAVAERLRGPDFEFILAGRESVGFHDLFQKVLAADRERLLTFVGELDTDQMQSALQSAHILLFPSYGEGLARLMLEAGNALMCPVAYNIPSNKDLIAEGRGFVVNTGNVAGLIETLQQLSRDRPTAATNAANYQRHIIDHFSLPALVERLDSIFREMMLESS